MTIQYFVFSDTGRIKQHVLPTNIRFTYSAESLDHSPSISFDFDVKFLDSFFDHIRFFRITFDDSAVPQEIEVMKTGEKFPLPNGWLSYSDFFNNFGFNCLFISNFSGIYFESCEKLFKAILEWGRTVADQAVREQIIEAVEYCD